MSSYVEVEGSLGTLLVDMDRQEYNVNHKETRRHVLLSAIDPADRYLTAETDLLRDLIDEEDHERLMAAIAKLQPQQRELLYRVYWNGEKQKDIAAEDGVSERAITGRMKKIYAALKKFMACRAAEGCGGAGRCHLTATLSCRPPAPTAG